MLGALKTYARANQATIVTPFILAGAMSPVTVAGTVAQTLAEALAGMALDAARQSRCAGRAGQLRLLALDAIGRADLRHARAGAGAVRDGCAGAAAGRAVPLRRRRCAPPRSPMRRQRSNRPTRWCRPASPASTSCCTPPAGSRAASPWATRNSSWTPTRRG